MAMNYDELRDRVDWRREMSLTLIKRNDLLSFEIADIIKELEPIVFSGGALSPDVDEVK